MILYRENHKDSTKKPIRKNKYGRVAGYKINIQNSVTFVYANNDLAEREIKKSHIYNHNKKNEIHRNKFNQGGERPEH